MITTVFEQIPDFFVEMYDAQFQQWAREFQKRGYYAAIVFNKTPGSATILGPDGNPVWKGCWLEAELDFSNPQNRRVIIKPRTDHDRDMIERHCKEMYPHFLH